MHFRHRMKTLLVRGEHDPPAALVDLVRAGSTEVKEVRADVGTRPYADRVVVWTGSSVVVDERRLRWPDDLDELRLLFQTAG
jgi:hypothetical protein